MCITAKSWITNVKTNIKCFKLNKMFHSTVYIASFKVLSSRSWYRVYAWIAKLRNNIFISWTRKQIVHKLLCM